MKLFRRRLREFVSSDARDTPAGDESEEEEPPKPKKKGRKGKKGKGKRKK